jgi:hypothetical protein
LPRRLTTEEFIRRARAAHGDKYDYSRVEYRGRHRKVAIGCPVCADEVNRARTRQRAEQWNLLRKESIRPEEIATVLETISQWTTRQGVEELTGYKASWFRDTAEVVEHLGFGEKRKE